MAHARPRRVEHALGDGRTTRSGPCAPSTAPREHGVRQNYAARASGDALALRPLSCWGRYSRTEGLFCGPGYVPTAIVRRCRRREKATFVFAPEWTYSKSNGSRQMVFIMRREDRSDIPSTRLCPRCLSPLSALASHLGLSARHGVRRRGPSSRLAPRAALNALSAKVGPRGPVHVHRAQRRGRQPAKGAAAVEVREWRRRPHRERSPGWLRGRRQRGRPPSVVGRHTQSSLQRQQHSLALQAGSLIGAEDIAQSIHK